MRSGRANGCGNDLHHWFPARLDRNQMAVGTYGFNSFLVGISIGVWFNPGLLLYIIIVLSAVLTLFISVAVRGFL
jgi:urea transporter